MATIALVLAIVSFVVQIVSSILANAANRAAEGAARRINFETNKVLEEIKSSAAANQSILARQFDTLLNALIKRGADRATSDGDDEGSRPEPPLDFRTLAPVLQAPSPSDERILEELNTFPTEEEAPPLIAKLKALPAAAVAMLDRYAGDELRSRRVGGEPGLQPVEGSAVHAHLRDLLRDAGLLKEVGDGFAALTEEGRQVARLLKGKGEPPPGVAAALGLPTEDPEPGSG